MYLSIIYGLEETNKEFWEERVDLVSFIFVSLYVESMRNYEFIIMQLYRQACIYMNHFFLWRYSPNLGLRLPP
jgi:hypothetical protein